MAKLWMFLALAVLATPTGDLSLNTLLWTAIGSSTGYQMATGWAELLAGVLLLLPQTVLLGALVGLVDMLHVFALNMAFDVTPAELVAAIVTEAGVLRPPDRESLAAALGEPPGAPGERAR